MTDLANKLREDWDYLAVATINEKEVGGDRFARVQHNIAEAADRISELEQQNAKLQEAVADRGMQLAEIQQAYDWSGFTPIEAAKVLTELQAFKAEALEVVATISAAPKHTRIFLTSRQKMHPDGVAIFDENIALAQAFLSNHKDKSDAQ